MMSGDAPRHTKEVSSKKVIFLLLRFLLWLDISETPPCVTCIDCGPWELEECNRTPCSLIIGLRSESKEAHFNCIPRNIFGKMIKNVKPFARRYPKILEIMDRFYIKTVKFRSYGRESSIVKLSIY